MMPWPMGYWECMHVCTLSSSTNKINDKINVDFELNHNLVPRLYPPHMHAGMAAASMPAEAVI